MGTNTAVDRLVQSVSFDVKAVPQQVVQISDSGNMTPVNVKIRVRKKDDVTQRGVITLSKYDKLNKPQERIRLANSDQTIASFNMLMESDMEREPRKKKGFFGGCLGTQYDDDDVPYLPTPNTDTSVSISESEILHQKLKLSKNADEALDARKPKTFFGKCKPGGCLDPPFGEDKYSYQPKDDSRRSGKSSPETEMEGIETESDDYKLAKLRNKSEKPSTTRNKNSSDSSSILDLYQTDKAEHPLEDNESDSIITYPPALSYSGENVNDQWVEKKHSNRSSTTSKSKKSFNEVNAPFFTKKDIASISSENKVNESDRHRRSDNLKEKTATAAAATLVAAAAAATATTAAILASPDNDGNDNGKTIPKTLGTDEDLDSNRLKSKEVGSDYDNELFEPPIKLHEKGSQERHSSTILKKSQFVVKGESDIRDDDERKLSQLRNLTIIEGRSDLDAAADQRGPEEQDLDIMTAAGSSVPKGNENDIDPCDFDKLIDSLDNKEKALRMRLEDNDNNDGQIPDKDLNISSTTDTHISPKSSKEAEIFSKLKVSGSISETTSNLTSKTSPTESRSLNEKLGNFENSPLDGSTKQIILDILTADNNIEPTQPTQDYKMKSDGDDVNDQKIVTDDGMQAKDSKTKASENGIGGIKDSYASKSGLKSGRGTSSKPTSPILSPTPSVILDMAFYSYKNEIKEKFIKTLDSDVDTSQFPKDSVTVVKTMLKPNGKEITVPIGSDMNLAIQIKKIGQKDPNSMKSKTQSEFSIPFSETSYRNVTFVDVGRGVDDDVKKGEAGTTSLNKTMANKIMHDVLNSIYEKELVPLQNVIKGLKEDIDALAGQQLMFREKLMGNRRAKPIKLVNLPSKRCTGCMRR